jgi:hypothetical protein
MKPKRLNSYIAARKAVQLAWVEKMTFTAPTLAMALNVTDNRHLRAVLKDLSKDGILASVNWLCEDGHYRKFFYAQGTKPMRQLFVHTEMTA